MRNLFASLFAVFFAVAALQAQTPDGGSGQTGPYQASESYVIVPLDIISFRIVGEPETQTEARVAADGSVSLPYVGTVKIAGLTVADARAFLFDRYNADFYVNPQLDLAVIGYKQRKVMVQGIVNRQGFVFFPPEEQLTLLDAIGLAGGWRNDRLSDQTRVVLTRTYPDGRTEDHKIDTTKISQRDWPLQDGDYIYVHERRW